MKYILLIFAACMFQSGFSQWTNLGLNNRKVMDLTILTDTIYASTDKGIFKKNYLNPDTIWTNCGMQDSSVFQTLVPDNKTFITLIRNEETYTTRLYKSVDAGNTFNLMIPNSSCFNEYSHIGIAYPANNLDTLYLVDFNLKTSDGGITWDSMHISSPADGLSLFNIKVNPTKNSQLITLGTTGLGSGILFFSDNYGDSWNHSISQLFYPDNIIHDIAINSKNEWYATAGWGDIEKSPDGGENWSSLPLIKVGFKVGFGSIDFSPIDENILYTSGYCDVDNKVYLFYSQDEGETWDTTSFKCNSRYQSISSLAVKSINNIDNVFLGGRGVFLYKNSFSPVPFPQSNEEFILFPNPVKDVLTIKTDKTIEKISVYNSEGKKLRSVEYRNNIDTSDFLAGIYIVEIEINGKLFFTKFIK